MITLQQLLENAGIETRDYSGRGMYGERCLAIEVDGQNNMAWIVRVLDEAVNTSSKACAEACNLLSRACRSARTDSMGRGMVVYWPNVPYEASSAGNEAGEGPCDFEGSDSEDEE